MCIKAAFEFTNCSNLNSAIAFHNREEAVTRKEIKHFIPGFHKLAESGTRSEKPLLLFLPKPAAHGSSASSPEKHKKHLSWPTIISMIHRTNTAGFIHAHVC